MTDKTEEYRLLRECYLSGQMSDKQLAKRLWDAEFAAWWDAQGTPTLSPTEGATMTPKRWLVEEHLPSGSIRWDVFEHEHQARRYASSRENPSEVTPLYAAPPAAPDAVKVKPLEWVKTNKSHVNHFSAASVDGQYYEAWENTSEARWCAPDMDISEKAHDLSSAKAAAQADYERRILSALSNSEAGQ